MEPRELFEAYMETNDITFAHQSAEQLAVVYFGNTVDDLVKAAADIAGNNQHGRVYSNLAVNYHQLLQQGKIPRPYQLPNNSPNILREIP